MRERVLDFLYNWVESNKISQIRKGMVEELVHFIDTEFSKHDSEKMAERMKNVAATQPFNSEVQDEPEA